MTISDKPNDAPKGAIRTKELRLALVCYGGVSLAVYIHGITKELWKLLKASEARNRNRSERGEDTEAVWRALLETISSKVNLNVICDVLAGASAGGINAVFLARAITDGLDLEPLRELWLENADIEHMLDPDAQPKFGSRRLAFLYKEPVAWYVERLTNLSSVDDPEVRSEISKKITHFVRSRWFKPPFSGDGFTKMLMDASDAMEKGPRGPALIPSLLGLDLYLTATDYHGITRSLPIHSPPFVMEKEHRRLFEFHSPPSSPDEERTSIGEAPELVFAARATASFPGAFPPATVGEVDRLLAKQGRKWANRDSFLKTQMSGDRLPEEVALIDGSVLANAPFDPAINAIRNRPANREVDRRFVYIDPKPDISAAGSFLRDREPGFFTAIYRAMAEIPREQPIQDSLESIAAVSARIRRIGSIIDHVAPAVDAAIRETVGSFAFLFSASPESLTEARAHIQNIAAREAGFAYVAYSQLKIRSVLDEAVNSIARAASADPNTKEHIHQQIYKAAEERGAFDHDIPHTDRNSGFVALLRGLDFGFRVRRLRFLLRELRSSTDTSHSLSELRAAEDLKMAIYKVMGPIQLARAICSNNEAMKKAAEALANARPEQQRDAANHCLDTLVKVLRLSLLDQTTDRVMAALANNEALAPDTRTRLIRAWIGFPFYDTAILPLMHDNHADTFDELKVDRISPDDATALCEGGTRSCLKGWQMNAFAAFFSRAYRENDYLWGRLHSAERLLDIIVTSVRGEIDIDVELWQNRLFSAILDAEAPHLTMVQPLIESLRRQLDNPRPGGSGPKGHAEAGQ